MFNDTESRSDLETVHLQNAVLCVDCETITASRRSECPVCGSRSLLGLARMLGGPLSAHKEDRARRNERVLYTVNINITLHRMTAEQFSAVTQGITSVIAPTLGREGASFHIDAIPLVERRIQFDCDAA